MGKQETPASGAMVERGKIAEVGAEGCKVKNLDRPGLTSKALTGIDDTEYAVGDMVLFVMFRDGTGKIFCKA